MRALSVRQPWAWAIAVGIKSLENRSFRPRVGERIAIHASVSIDDDGIAWMRRRDIVLPDAFITRAVIGLATISDCVRSHDSQWFVGPFAWLLSDVVAIPPVPCRGHLSLWHLSAEIEQQLTCY